MKKKNVDIISSIKGLDNDTLIKLQCLFNDLEDRIESIENSIRNQ